MLLLLVASLVAFLAVSGASSSPRLVESRWVVRDLGVSGTAIALNDRGQIVVQATQSVKAFLWENGRMTDLGTLGGGYAGVSDINERSQIVGQSRTKAAKTHVVLWTLRSG